MPVPAPENFSKTFQDVLQGRLHGRGTFKQFEIYVAGLKTKNGESIHCSPSMMTDIKAIFQQEIKSQNFANIKTLLCCIQHIATGPTHDCGLPVLLENGLVDLLAYTYNAILQPACPRDHTSPQQTSVDAQACFIQLLETLNDVADHSPLTKEQVSQAFVERLMAFIVTSEGNFTARMEAIRTLNLLLEGCSSQCLSDLRNTKVENLLKEFAEFLPKAGDFEMQVACTESLARFIKKSERELFSEKCFPNEAVAASFLKIRDACFEVDCRKFLNELNKSQRNGRGVFSLPCEKAFLGQYKLKCPQDDSLVDFWVDFNSVSRSITIYVAEEGASEDTGMWETVTLQDDKVRRVDIKKFGDFQHLNISLTVPVSQILPFCKSNSQTALIIFHPLHDLHLPLSCCFSPDKLPSQNKVRRKSSECTIKVLFSRIGEGGSIHTENFYGRSGATKKASHQKESSKSRSTAVPMRTKTSTPLNPMTSPPRQSMKDQDGSNSHIKKRCADTTPKTPKEQHPKRVKTPLNVSVSDKTSRAGGIIEDTRKTGTSKTKDDTRVSAHTSIASSSQRRLDESPYECDDIVDDDVDGKPPLKDGAASESKEDQNQKSGEDMEGKIVEIEVKRSGSDHKRAPPSKENDSLPDGIEGTDEKRQNSLTPQIVPESQYSQTVIEDTQEMDVPDSHQASESPLETSQSASQGRRNGRRKKRQQPRGRGTRDQRKKRTSPRLEALKQMTALNPGKEKRSKSGKFKLYSQGEGLVGDNVIPGDIIPSSCPSQDSMADFVPDTCPMTRKGKEQKSTGRKSSSSPGMSDIPEKSTESTDSTETDNRKTARTKPKRKRSNKAQVKPKPVRKRQKSKKAMMEENEDETSSVSSTLHQTREFLSQSLPILAPNDSYNEDGDPYLFSDINESSKKVQSVNKKETKERVTKVMKPKRNLNRPDKSSFLHKKSFMSFPGKSLTLPLVDPDQVGKTSLNQSVVDCKDSHVDGTGDRFGTTRGLGADGKDQGGDKNFQRANEERRVRGKKTKKVPPKMNGKKRRQGKKDEEIVRCDDDLEEEEIVSNEDKKLEGKMEERKAGSDSGEELKIEMKGFTNRKKRGRDVSEGVGDDSFVGEKKISKGADVSFASRQMLEMSDVEVMRDAVQLEEEFQDDELHGLIQSVKKFLGRGREGVARKHSHEESTSRMEGSLKEGERVGEGDLEKESDGEKESNEDIRDRQGETAGESEEDVREEDHETDAMERQKGKKKTDKESESGMSFSDDEDAMEEINKELRALSKELQETGKRKRKQQQEGLSEKYEEQVTNKDKKEGEKKVMKTSRGTPKYGSDIEDDDEVLSNLSLDFDDKKTEASVQSFSRLCKSIVCQSGDGIAKNRSRRDLPKVDYKDQDVSFSDEEYSPSLDIGPFNVSSDTQVDEDEHSPSNTSRRTPGFTDVQSERSWLVKKSQIKVSTYSKVQRKRWAKGRGEDDVFKTVKKTQQKKRMESKKRSASPENVAIELLAPKKKKKKMAEEDGATDFLYYQQNSERSHPGPQEQLIQKVSSKVQRANQGITPSSSHNSKSSGKSKILDISSDELIEPFSQELMIKSQTTPATPCWDVTPQVGEDEVTQSDGEDPDAVKTLLSGPSKMSTLTQSFLKRKYEHMVEDITRSNDEDNPGEDALEEEDEAEMDSAYEPPLVRRSINPRRLFENELLALGSKKASHGDNEPIQMDGESTSVTASSSSSNHSWKDPDFRIPEMVAIVGQKIQRQFAEKRNQTMLMTDSVLKSTQKYLSKIWTQQNHGRQAALEDFRESLLKEIVTLEMDVENLNKTSAKLQAMAQRRLKTGLEMNSKHAMHIRSLHQSYIQELNEMDLYLEENLKKSVKTIVEQEFGSLKKKLLNDLHAQDVTQMKRALHSYLSL